MPKKIIFLIVTLIFLLLPFNAKALTINLFYGEECPHCEHEREYLDSLEKQYGDNITIKTYEVWHNEKNDNLLKKVREALGDDNKGVPYTVIGTYDFTGYSDRTANEIRNLIIQSIATPIPDVIDDIKDGKEITSAEEIDSSITVPILGEVNPEEVSLPLLALTLGFSDSFNPCAIWVLLFFVALMFSIKDKKRMWLTGITYIVITALTYALFMVTWTHIPNSELPQAILSSALAIIAIIVGALNLNYFLRYGSQEEEKKSKFLIIKNFFNKHKFSLTLILTIILMIAINLIELTASSGSPLLFTSVLNLNDIGTFSYIINIIIYIFFFILDDIIVFFVLMLLKYKTKLFDKHSKYLSLISGIILFVIAISLIFKPEWFMFNF